MMNSSNDKNLFTKIIDMMKDPTTLEAIKNNSFLLNVIEEQGQTIEELNNQIVKLKNALNKNMNSIFDLATEDTDFMQRIVDEKTFVDEKYPHVSVCYCEPCKMIFVSMKYDMSGPTGDIVCSDCQTKLCNDCMEYYGLSNYFKYENDQSECSSCN